MIEDLHFGHDCESSGEDEGWIGSAPLKELIVYRKATPRMNRHDYYYAKRPDFGEVDVQIGTLLHGISGTCGVNFFDDFEFEIAKELLHFARLEDHRQRIHHLTEAIKNEDIKRRLFAIMDKAYIAAFVLGTLKTTWLFQTKPINRRWDAIIVLKHLKKAYRPGGFEGNSGHKPQHTCRLVWQSGLEELAGYSPWVDKSFEGIISLPAEILKHVSSHEEFPHLFQYCDHPRTGAFSDVHFRCEKNGLIYVFLKNVGCDHSAPSLLFNNEMLHIDLPLGPLLNDAYLETIAGFHTRMRHCAVRSHVGPSFMWLKFQNPVEGVGCTCFAAFPDNLNVEKALLSIEVAQIIERFGLVCDSARKQAGLGIFVSSYSRPRLVPNHACFIDMVSEDGCRQPTDRLSYGYKSLAVHRQIEPYYMGVLLHNNVGLIERNCRNVEKMGKKLKTPSEICEAMDQLAVETEIANSEEMFVNKIQIHVPDILNNADETIFMLVTSFTHMDVDNGRKRQRSPEHCISHRKRRFQSESNNSKDVVHTQLQAKFWLGIEDQDYEHISFENVV